MPESPPLAAPPPAALVAFLRGVERRAALFAELQTGDAEVGDLAVATTMRQFQAEAAGLPMADWPRRFWQRLTASAPLRQGRQGRWSVEVVHLATLAPSDRMALLTRLAGGLPEDEAVEVLSTDLTHYRAALAAACPTDAAGQPDALGWRALADAIQARSRELSDERMARLARLRDHALHATASARPAVTSAPPTRLLETPASPSRWKKWWLVLVVVLCCLALLATFLPGSWWSSTRLDAGGEMAGPGLAEDPKIQVEALPAAEAPASTWPQDAASATHPDLPLLRDSELALAQQADFYAWYLAGATQASSDAATNAAPSDATPEATQEEGRDTTF